MAKQVTRNITALDAPATIEQYFSALYQYEGDSLDQKHVVSSFEQGAQNKNSYPFRTVAEKFQIIDNNTRTVLIPRSETARALAERLRAGERSRALLRQAAQESVNIYPQHVQSLLNGGALEPLDESMFLLTDSSLYSEQTGLALSADSGVGIFL